MQGSEETMGKGKNGYILQEFFPSYLSPFPNMERMHENEVMEALTDLNRSSSCHVFIIESAVYKDQSSKYPPSCRAEEQCQQP